MINYYILCEYIKNYIENQTVPLEQALGARGGQAEPAKRSRIPAQRYIEGEREDEAQTEGRVDTSYAVIVNKLISPSGCLCQMQ